MTTDAFTEAARIIDAHRENERWVGDGVKIECVCGHTSHASGAVTHYPITEAKNNHRDAERMHAAHVAQVLAAQEPTDAERAVRALHRPAHVYTLAEDCTDPESHEWSGASHGNDELCLNEPTGEQFCVECCPEDVFDCTDYPYPCPTIQALDSARAARRDVEKRNG